MVQNHEDAQALEQEVRLRFEVLRARGLKT
jgi:hypothetical protein